MGELASSRRGGAMTIHTGKRRACIECGRVRVVDWQGVCGPCGDYLDGGTVLEAPELAADGVLVRQVCIAGCEDAPPKQLHPLTEVDNG